MRRHATWWAMVALVLALALAGSAHAGGALVGGRDDDYGRTLRIYRFDEGVVGVSVYDNGESHIALMSRSQAHTLASMLESGWRKRNAYGRNTITGSVNGPDGSRAMVAVAPEPAPLQVSLAVEDTDTGMAASFWSDAGAIRYLANTLRRAAR
jgi:hypothetical protein